MFTYEPPIDTSADDNPLVAIWVGLVPEVATEEMPNKVYRAADLKTHAKLILEAAGQGYKYISLGLELTENPHINRDDVYTMSGMILKMGVEAGLKMVGQKPVISA